MDIRIESSLHQLPSAKEHLFTEVAWRPLLILIGAIGIAIITGAALVHESSMERGPAGVDVDLGGPITTYGVVVGVIYVFWWAAHAWPIHRDGARLSAERGAGWQMYYEMSDAGVAFGVEGLWEKRFSWKLVSEVIMKRDECIIVVHQNRVWFDIRRLSQSERAELEAFLASTREPGRDDRLFGFHFGGREQRTFGAIRRDTIATGAKAP